MVSHCSASFLHVGSGRANEHKPRPTQQLSPFSFRKNEADESRYQLMNCCRFCDGQQTMPKIAAGDLALRSINSVAHLLAWIQATRDPAVCINVQVSKAFCGPLRRGSALY
jgi:hypothetical protein